MKKKKKLLEKDKQLLEFFRKGGRDGAKEDFVSLLRKAAQPLKGKRKK